MTSLRSNTISFRFLPTTMFSFPYTNWRVLPSPAPSGISQGGFSLKLNPCLFTKTLPCAGGDPSLSQEIEISPAFHPGRPQLSPPSSMGKEDLNSTEFKSVTPRVPNPTLSSSRICPCDLKRLVATVAPQRPLLLLVSSTVASRPQQTPPLCFPPIPKGILKNYASL